jgi:hypothetical protein
MPEDDDDRAEHALEEIDANRLKSVRETNERAFKEGTRFSMSNMQTLDMPAAKFELTGLDDEQAEGEADAAVIAALSGLSETQQEAIKKALANVTTKTVKHYIQADWDNIAGKNNEVDLNRVTEAFGQAGLSNTDRAHLLWIITNFDKIRDLQ